MGWQHCYEYTSHPFGKNKLNLFKTEKYRLVDNARLVLAFTT